jgi:hypothetical protein
MDAVPVPGTTATGHGVPQDDLSRLPFGVRKAVRRS